jgi:hypothetical protein
MLVRYYTYYLCRRASDSQGSRGGRCALFWYLQAAAEAHRDARDLLAERVLQVRKGATDVQSI